MFFINSRQDDHYILFSLLLRHTSKTFQSEISMTIPNLQHNRSPSLPTTLCAHIPSSLAVNSASPTPSYSSTRSQSTIHFLENTRLPTPQIFASKNVSHSRFTSSIILPAAYSLCSASKLPLNWCSWARSWPILLNRHESKMTFIRAVNAKRDKAVNR